MYMCKEAIVENYIYHIFDALIFYANIYQLVIYYYVDTFSNPLLCITVHVVSLWKCVLVIRWPVLWGVVGEWLVRATDDRKIPCSNSASAT